jgi:hypothetical protein
MRAVIVIFLRISPKFLSHLRYVIRQQISCVKFSCVKFLTKRTIAALYAPIIIMSVKMFGKQEAESDTHLMTIGELA